MEQIFDKIPKSSVEYVRCLISSENIIFKLKKSRRTKHGDFSIKKNGLVIITINEDLNGKQTDVKKPGKEKKKAGCKKIK